MVSIAMLTISINKIGKPSFMAFMGQEPAFLFCQKFIQRSNKQGVLNKKV